MTFDTKQQQQNTTPDDGSIYQKGLAHWVDKMS